jgi:hypothetical protein
MVRGQMVYFAVMTSLIQRSHSTWRRAIQTDLHLIDPYRDLRQTSASTVFISDSFWRCSFELVGSLKGF